MMNRRSLLGAMLAACAAPAYVKAGILMPVRKVWTPFTLGMDLAKAPDQQGSLAIFDGAGNLLVTVALASMAGGKFSAEGPILRSGRAEQAKLSLPGLPDLITRVSDDPYGAGLVLDNQCFVSGSDFHISGVVSA
jgi:hypothetical protein